MKNSKNIFIGLLVALVMVGGAGKAEAYLLDVGGIRLGQFVDNTTSANLVGVYLDSSYDFKDVAINVLYNEGQVSLSKSFSSTGFPTNTFMVDPITELLTPALDNSDGTFGTFIKSISFSANLQNNSIGSLAAISGEISAYWYNESGVYYDSLPAIFSVADFAALKVNVADIQPVPEPASIVLLAAGAVGLIIFRRRG
jgi:hypothetical protein